MTLRPRISPSGPLAPSGPGSTPDLEEVLAEGNSAGNERITDLEDPVDPQDAATKAYVDTASPNRIPLSLPWNSLDLTTSYQTIVSFEVEEDGWYQISNVIQVANGASFNGAPVLVVMILSGPTTVPIIQRGFFPIGPGIPSSGQFWQGGQFTICPTLYLTAGTYEVQARAEATGGFADTSPRIYCGGGNPLTVLQL